MQDGTSLYIRGVYAQGGRRQVAISACWHPTRRTADRRRRPGRDVRGPSWNTAMQMGHARPIDFPAFDALTFDCYGTLIDWETGILDGLQPVLEAHGVERDGDELLEAYAGHEAELEAGPYLLYRELLAESLRRLGADLGFTPSEDELAAFSRSVSDWPAFAD